MKRILPLLLSLLLLAGCSSAPAADDPNTMTLEEYQDLLRTEPLATTLHPEVYAACSGRQVVGLETQEDGILFRVTEAMTDGQTLYVAFELTFPEHVDIANNKEILGYGLFSCTLNGASPPRAFRWKGLSSTAVPVPIISIWVRPLWATSPSRRLGPLWKART
ncbi:MAG: hypothetical protein IJE03_02020 [Ruminiclostridium sp.]|nr:hypothetical protein [Ruminiclostridium sp.]